jgi:ADP-dependent NAD(P)H-hydrate dehydratase / NAD(P)H-hydrate epimerase
MKIVAPETMKKIDRRTIEELGIPSRILMENAGLGCAEYIRKEILTKPANVLCVCGSGNNGGDGLVIARWLAHWHYPVQIIMVGDAGQMSEETKLNYELCKKLNISIFEATDPGNWQKQKMNLVHSSIVIDAIFGIGFKGKLDDFLNQVVNDLNKYARIIVSIDIPSGLNGFTGNSDSCIHAHYTLTLASLKYGLILNEGMLHSGITKVIDIGIPDEYYAQEKSANLVTKETVVFPTRNRLNHKGSYGRIAVIAGSPGFAGAALLSSKACLRAGAGLVTLFYPMGMETIFAGKVMELMSQTIPQKNDGIYEHEQLLEKLEPFDVLLIGPGIGKSKNIQELAAYLLKYWTKPMIIDADGLNALAADSSMLFQLKDKPILLTPHMGEFARLVGISIEELEKDIIGHLAKFVQTWGTHVLLKSSITIYAAGEHMDFIITGNDGLATGGSGDVLAGIATSFIGQHLPIHLAAPAASWILGKTAESLARMKGTPAILPTDVIDHLFDLECYES